MANQEQYHLVAYSEAVNDKFQSEETLLHAVASSLIDGRWLKFNDAQTFLSELDNECYLCMAVYKSQHHSLNDNVRVNITKMTMWRGAVRQFQLSRYQETSAAPTATSTPPQSKLLLTKHVSNLNS